MKHAVSITALLLGMFIVTQLIGLAVVGYYAPRPVQIVLTNTTIVNDTGYGLPYGMNPPAENDPSLNLVSMIIALIVAVVVMFALMKFHAAFILRGWFFLVVTFAIAITLHALLRSLGIASEASWAALIIALPLSFGKIFQRNIFVHNATELLIYPGIAAIFVPLLSLWTVVGLLVFISAYDMYAVWHAGFMQKMAKYQMEKLKMFAGFLIPYRSNKDKATAVQSPTKAKKENEGKVKVNVALLGGGDVVFPIVCSGTVLHLWGLAPALAVVVGATLALGLLFYYSEKGKFYPAMPFISAGCIAGLIVAYFL